MDDAAPALWVVIVTGVMIGLVASLIGHWLLGLPRVKVKVRHVAKVDEDGDVGVLSYVSATNLRGRPVTIDQAFILVQGEKHGPGMSRPKGWEFPVRLTEGQNVKLTFERNDFPKARAVVIDSADRIWPRLRWLRVKRRALWAGNVVGWPWQRNGPTQRQLERLDERVEGLRRQRAQPKG